MNFMFGQLRFFLAYMVVLSHLVGSHYFAHYGYYAVRGFFVLSGFIITAALNEVYRFDGERFWTNRLLRLLPPCYVVCAATLAFVAFVPDQAAAYLKFWQLDAGNQRDVLMNLLVLPLQFRDPQFRFSPAYWSLAVEIEMYVLLWLVIARREAFAAAALGVGIVYHLVCLEAGYGVSARYFSAPSALLSFAAGALVYFLRRRGAFKVDVRCGLIAFALWVVNMAAAGSILPDSYVYGASYYIGTLAFVFVVSGLADYKPGPRLARIDKTLGDIAYPLFLVQWLAGFIVALAFFPGTWRGWALTLVATPFMVGLAIGLAKFNDLLIEPLRDRVRTGAWRKSPAQSAPAPADPGAPRAALDTSLGAS
jgi:peptidoglycan/LPS O-acetylase OafA/YrhL